MTFEMLVSMHLLHYLDVQHHIKIKWLTSEYLEILISNFEHD